MYNIAQSQSLQVDAGVELRLNEQVQRWCRLTATDRQKGSRVIGLNRAPTSVGVFDRQLWREERASSAPLCSCWWPRNLLEIIMKCVLCIEPFSWEDYLRETSSIAASPTCFKQVSLWLMGLQCATTCHRDASFNHQYHSNWTHERMSICFILYEWQKYKWKGLVRSQVCKYN